MRKKILPALFAAVFVCCTVDVHASSESRKSSRLYKKAKSDIKKGLYLTAYDKLSEAYWLDPFNDGALKEMDNITLSFKKKLAEWAEYDFEQKAYASGFLFYTQGDYKKAVKEWTKVLMIKENTEVRGYYEYVNRELKAGAEKDILLYGGKAKKDREDAEKLKKARKKKRKRVRRPAPKAKPSPRKAKQAPKRKIDKAKAEGHYNEGLKQYSQGYLKLAVASWKNALKYDPGHTRAKRALSRAKKKLEKK